MSKQSDLIRRMPPAFDPVAAGDLRMTLQCAVSQPISIAIDGGQCSDDQGAASRPDITRHASDNDRVEPMTGRLNGVDAALSGRVEVDGDPMLAQQRPAVFDRAGFPENERPTARFRDRRGR